MPDAIAALEQSPLPSVIKNLGVAIAEAQLKMDQTSAEIAKLLASKETGVEIDGVNYSLLELGFAPTFYQITEATVEARVAFSAAQSEAFKIGAKIGANVGFFAASVDASYSSKYSYEASGSSAITARFVTVPPPSIFNDRLRSALKPTTPNEE